MRSFFTDIFHRAVLASIIGLLLAAPSPASAQAAPIQTPQAYCKFLGNPSCEVLNIDIGGMGVNNSMSWPQGAGIIKYCKNGVFKLMPLLVYTTVNQVYIESATISASTVNQPFSNTDCAVLP